MILIAQGGTVALAATPGAWQTDTVPFTVTVVDATSDGMSPFIAQAAVEWSASGIVNVVVVHGGCGKRGGAYTICSSPLGADGAGANGAFSLTGFQYTHGFPYLKQVTTTFNDYWLGSQSTFIDDGVRLWVACHEMAYGLGEYFLNNPESANTDTASCFSGNQGATAPAQSDFDRLSQEYPNP